MWSNEISLDKKYAREIDYIAGKLNAMKDVSFAMEESEDRVWIYLASVCERQDAVEEELFEIVETVLLTFFKARFFVERLGVGNMGFARCVLICSLVHFDRDFERTVLRKVLSNALDYNLDGLLNFRLRALKDEWEELAGVSLKLLESASNESEVFEVSSFITGGEQKRCRVVLEGEKVKNLTEHTLVDVVNVFDDEEFNYLFAILGAHPSEIVLDGVNMSKGLNATLRKISRVTEK